MDSVAGWVADGEDVSTLCALNKLWKASLEGLPFLAVPLAALALGVRLGVRLGVGFGFGLALARPMPNETNTVCYTLPQEADFGTVSHN